MSDSHLVIPTGMRLSRPPLMPAGDGDPAKHACILRLTSHALLFYKLHSIRSRRSTIGEINPVLHVICSLSNPVSRLANSQSITYVFTK